MSVCAAEFDVVVGAQVGSSSCIRHPAAFAAVDADAASGRARSNALFFESRKPSAAAGEGQEDFPLFAPGANPAKFAYAVFLLNKVRS
jgi:hypothetical protein